MGVLSKSSSTDDDQQKKCQDICRQIETPTRYYRRINSGGEIVFNKNVLPQHFAIHRTTGSKRLDKLINFDHYHHVIIEKVEETNVGLKYTIIEFDGEKQKKASIKRSFWSEQKLATEIAFGFFRVEHPAYANFAINSWAKKAAQSRIDDIFTNGWPRKVYKLTSNNCEHLCTWIMMKKAFCTQIGHCTARSIGAHIYHHFTNRQEVLSKFIRLLISFGQEGFYFIKYLFTKCPQTNGFTKLCNEFCERVTSRSFAPMVVGSKVKLIFRAGFGQLLVALFELIWLYFEDADEEEKWRRFIVILASNVIGFGITVAAAFIIPIPFVDILLGWIGKEVAAIAISHYQQVQLAKKAENMKEIDVDKMDLNPAEEMDDTIMMESLNDLSLETLCNDSEIETHDSDNDNTNVELIEEISVIIEPIVNSGDKPVATDDESFLFLPDADDTCLQCREAIACIMPRPCGTKAMFCVDCTKKLKEKKLPCPDCGQDITETIFV